MSLETGLAGKVVIVTGADSGIGRATSRRFAQERALVAACDVNESLADAGPELAAHAGDAMVDRVDVSDAAAVAGGVARVVARWGRADVLVNNAGILRDAQLVKWKDGEVLGVMSDADFDAVLDVNLRGPFLCARAVVPHMIAAGGGAIVNVSSVVGVYGNFGQTNYVASKAGLIGMTRVWARELGRYNIRVNAVAPGFIDTPMARSIPDRALDGIVARTPLKRIGRPEELADAYVWLASDAASFVTGAVVSVDGGLVVGT
jgi:3-oxoacyl-[acyl-carrier protein] reductase